MELLERSNLATGIDEISTRNSQGHIPLLLFLSDISTLILLYLCSNLDFWDHLLFEAAFLFIPEMSSSVCPSS